MYNASCCLLCVNTTANASNAVMSENSTSPSTFWAPLAASVSSGGPIASGWSPSRVRAKGGGGVISCNHRIAGWILAAVGVKLALGEWRYFTERLNFVPRISSSSGPSSVPVVLSSPTLSDTRLPLTV